MNVPRTLKWLLGIGFGLGLLALGLIVAVFAGLIWLLFYSGVANWL